MTYHIGDIVYEDEYTDAVDWCYNNNATMNEIEADQKGRRFQIVEIAPYIPTHEDIREQREQYRKTHIDSKTAERSRRQANGSWTEEDEQAYLALDAEVTAYIEEHYPYPEE